LKTQSSLPSDGLLNILRQQYGLEVESLEFLPTEWTAYCYRVHCVGGQEYFLKLTRRGGFVPYAASDPGFYLPLTAALQRCGILPHIAYPIPACDGRFLWTSGDDQLILFNYIHGRTVGFGDLFEEILPRLAVLLGILHRGVSQVRLDYVFQEQFALPFEADLLRSLSELRTVSATDSQGKRDLRALLLPRVPEILDLLKRLKELQAYAQAARKPQVFCHTDLHGGNLMLDEQDNLYILDWEGALLAPPEQDLFFHAWKDDFWQNFLPAYEGQFGPVRLDSAIFGFYFYRRNLEDLTDWVVRILRYNTQDEQDAADVQGIQQDCLAGWPYLEKNIQFIESRLAERNSKYQ